MSGFPYFCIRWPSLPQAAWADLDGTGLSEECVATTVAKWRLRLSPLLLDGRRGTRLRWRICKADAGLEGWHESTVESRDVAVPPAGTGHRRIQADSRFLVIGTYPVGQNWDICRRAPNAAGIERMRRLPFPKSDPISSRKQLYGPRSQRRGVGPPGSSIMFQTSIHKFLERLNRLR
jgi:hypothetical protein